MVRTLLGVSTFQRPPSSPMRLDDEEVQRLREVYAGGQLQPLPTTQTRWYLQDLERAKVDADRGHPQQAARLCVAMMSDGTLAGLARTLTSGVVRLPRRLYGGVGNETIVAALEKNSAPGTRSTFDEFLPPAEVAAFLRDGIHLGIAVGEFLDVPGRDFPVFRRLEPEFLEYRWNEDRWYYRSIVGYLPITPGDGRWVLHIHGGRTNPWRAGLWYSLARAYIKKEHALLHQANYSAKLANPARVGTAPLGSTEGQREGFFARIAAWGVNSVFELLPGWDIKLLESNGRGWEIFTKEIEQADQEFMIALAGQVVTTTGGSGFANADVHRLIRNDILQDVADALAYTINTQCLPLFAYLRGGPDAVARGVVVEYQTKAPKDLEVESRTILQFATAVQNLTLALKPYGRVPAVAELCTRFGIPTVSTEDTSSLLEAGYAEAIQVDVVDTAEAEANGKSTASV